MDLSFVELVYVMDYVGGPLPSLVDGKEGSIYTYMSNTKVRFDKHISLESRQDCGQ